MSTQVEAERKYQLDADQQPPSLAALGGLGRTREFVMVAAYYDTLDFRLTRAGCVLRRRAGGDDEGWHLKLPGPNSVHRIEVQEPLAATRVPATLRAQVADIVSNAALVPVASLRTLRAETPLLGADGARLAVICDDRVTATVGKGVTDWRELEVELLTGPASLLEDVDVLLTAAGIAHAGGGSKIAQALTGALVASSARTVTPETAAWEVVRDYLAAQVGVLQSREAAVRVDEPDAVHRSRVATRRLRSALRTFAGLFDRAVIRELRDELRWHAEELGAPRDAEVLKERLLESLAALPPELAPEAIRTRITQSLDEAHRRAHAELVTTMGQERYDRLHVSLERLVADPPLNDLAVPSAGTVLPAMLNATEHRVHRLAEHARAKPADLTRWHEVRKAAKAARYCSEALVKAFGAPAKELAEAWEKVTEAFGEVQDTVVAQQVIGEMAWEAVRAGLPRAPFDELQHDQEERRREALARGMTVLDDALQRAMSANLAEVAAARSAGDSST